MESPTPIPKEVITTTDENNRPVVYIIIDGNDLPDDTSAVKVSDIPQTPATAEVFEEIPQPPVSIDLFDLDIEQRIVQGLTTLLLCWRVIRVVACTCVEQCRRKRTARDDVETKVLQTGAAIDVLK